MQHIFALLFLSYLVSIFSDFKYPLSKHCGEVTADDGLRESTTVLQYELLM
jgi:hypothetical protein